MKLWQKETGVNRAIEQFTVGKDAEMDLLLAEYDVLGSLAHTAMLHSIGLLESDELTAVHTELKNIYEDIKAGKFIIEPGVEDVHSQVELLLTRKLGDAGKKIHSGRSRNDQVLVDLKLFIRENLHQTVILVTGLFDKLIEQSNKNKDILLPGYTHLQVAMPSSFGLWFGAYAESLSDDLHLLHAAYKIANKNPLGSGAGYGSSFPLNRQMTTDLLGFDSLNYNVVYAQMGRGKTEWATAQALASVATTLSRFAMDVCLYMSQNFGFITLPVELTTGSSIMPHKKNPDVFELTRAKCNKMRALPGEIAMITGNLPSGYHRDMQLIKENFLPAFAEINDCLSIMTFMADKFIISQKASGDEKYLYMWSVERVNQLVLSGIPFRDAYKQVGSEIETGTFAPPPHINHTHEGSIGNLMNDAITKRYRELLDTFNFEAKDKAVRALLGK